MLRNWFLVIGLVLAVGVVGCKPREEVIEVKAASDPLNEPRMILQRYVEGQPLGSEVTSFPDMVANLEKVDPAKAKILDKGFKDIQNAPAQRAEIAKELLKKLGPATK
jgi:hypothetical protein